MPRPRPGSSVRHVGKLLYGPFGAEFQFDDRLLAHLQIVIGSKLRRHECFFFTWRDDQSAGDGRSALWISSAIPLYFKYHGSKTPEINREWLEVLSATANSSGGLQIVEEPHAAHTPHHMAQHHGPNGNGHSRVR